MTAALDDVRRMASSRDVRSRGARAASWYTALLVTALVAAPVVRAVWIVAADPAVAEEIAGLLDVRALALVPLVCATAVLVGGARGPVVLPPMLAYVVGRAPIAADVAHRRAIIGSCAIGGVLGACLAGAVALLQVAASSWSAGASMLAIAGGAGVGVVAVVLWLLGQVARRGVRTAVAGALLAVALLTAVMPEAVPVTSWAATSAAAAIVGALAVPPLLRRLDPRTVRVQSARWDAASGHAAMLDLGSAAAAYRMHPARGRAVDAVRPAGSRRAVIVVRDVIGAFRTPGRLAGGLAGLVIAGGLIAVAVASPHAWMLAVPAAFVGALASSVLADGLLHAVEVARSAALYGLPDLELVTSHAVVPVTGTAALLLVGAIVGTVVVGGDPLSAALASVVLACGIVAARVASRLRGAPSALLHLPVVTHMGDLGAMLRAVASLEGVLTVVAVGLASVAAAAAPLVTVVVGACLVAIVAVRWRRRRA